MVLQARCGKRPVSRCAGAVRVPFHPFAVLKNVTPRVASPPLPSCSVRPAGPWFCVERNAAVQIRRARPSHRLGINVGSGGGWQIRGNRTIHADLVRAHLARSTTLGDRHLERTTQHATDSRVTPCRAMFDLDLEATTKVDDSDWRFHWTTRTHHCSSLATVLVKRPSARSSIHTSGCRSQAPSASRPWWPS